MSTSLHLNCPSGAAANLLVTALIHAGVPDTLIADIPDRLGLTPQFHVTEHDGVYDGTYRTDPQRPDPTGTPQDMIDIVTGAYPGIVGERTAAALYTRYRHDPDPISPGEPWSDTMFDATAVTVGLDYLGWPTLTIHGPLPLTRSANPVAQRILTGWRFYDLPVPVELVTPTAAALLHHHATQTLTAGPPADDFISGRFATALHLDPIELSLTGR